MALEYFPCYHSYRRKIAKLSDQEVGRLFRSLLEYSETGETQELTGREAVAFDFIADDIDRAKEAYAEKCEKNRSKAKKRWNENDAMACSGMQQHADGCQTCQDKSKSKDKDKSKEIYIGAPAPAHASPAAEIVGYLNEKAGTCYKSSSKTTQRHINARLEEGFTIDDFRAVIDKKCGEWLGDTKFEAYLRPETLFGTKFESYLNAPERSENGSDCGNPGQEWGELDGIKRL